MQLKVGNKWFEPNSALPAPSTTMLRKNQMAYSRQDTVAVTYILQGTSQADIRAKVLALNAALIQPNSDVLFYHDDGSLSWIYLCNFGSSNGVQLTKGPVYPVDLTKGGIYANYMEVTFEYQAEYPLINAGTQYAGGVPFGGPGPQGGAAVAQVDTITPASVTIGNIFTITVSPATPITVPPTPTVTIPLAASVSFTATANTVANVTAGLVAACVAAAAAGVPAFQALNPSDNSTNLTLTAINAGTPFLSQTTVATGTGSPGETLTDVTTVANVASNSGNPAPPGQGTGWIQDTGVGFPGAPSGTGGGGNLPGGP